MAGTSDRGGQSLAEIAEYHNDTVDALTFFLQALWQQGASRFHGSSPAGFRDLLHDRIEETELRSSFAILAAVEATFRNDCEFRATNRLKGELSKAFREIYRTRKKRERVRLDDILDLWVQHDPSVKRAVGELRGALHFRHWLAHGRYWERPAHGGFDYLSIYNLAELVFAFPFVLRPPAR